MIPYSNYYPEDWDEKGNLINRDRIEVSKLIVDYTQPGDCAEDVENYQTIRLESENNGTAPFIRISMPEGGHWSVGDLDDLKPIFEDFKERLHFEE